MMGRRAQARYSIEDCENGFPHTKREVLKAFIIEFLHDEPITRIRKYGFWWEVHMSICHTRGRLYWDYRNGNHPADKVLEQTNKIAKSLMRIP